jgi:hypothetical protein
MTLAQWKGVGTYDVARFHRWLAAMSEAVYRDDPLAWAIAYGYGGA